MNILILHIRRYIQVIRLTKGLIRLKTLFQRIRYKEIIKYLRVALCSQKNCLLINNRDIFLIFIEIVKCFQKLIQVVC